MKKILNTYIITDKTQNDNLKDDIDLLIVLNKDKNIKLLNLPTNIKYIVLRNEVDEQNIKVPFDCEIQTFSIQNKKRIMYVFELPKRFKLDFLQEIFNEFIQMHSDEVIFAYEFIDNANISDMIHYNQDNFNDMPRDIPLIFRGLIRSNDVF